MIRTLLGEGTSQKQATLDKRELSSSAKAPEKELEALLQGALNALIDNQLVFIAMGAFEHMSGRD